MKYTSLFLDLDNTLLDFDLAEKNAIKKVLQAHSLPCDDDAIALYHEINKSFWERFERREIAKDDIFEGRFEVFLAHYNLKGDVSAISKEYCKYLSEGYYTVKGAIEILEYLKLKGYKLYATTNGISLTQYKRIENSGIKPYFDMVFVSETVGSQKPEKEYFDYVIENISEKDRNKMLIIGDSMSSDILGGINSDIDTCWYNPTGVSPKFSPNYEISDLFELKRIL